MRSTVLLSALLVMLSHSALAQSVLLTDTFQPEPDFTVSRTSVVGLPQALPKITAEQYAVALSDLSSQLGYTCSAQGEFMLWDDTAEKGLAFDELLGASELPTAVLEHLRALGYPAEAYEVDSVKLRALSASGFALQTSAQPIVGIIGESWYSAKDEQIFFAALYWCTTA